jgi:ketosteroid isomerase-like protein
MTAAVHHLAERITITSAEGTQTAWVLATNVYLKTEQGWRLVVHHASPGSVGEPPPVMGEPPSLLH